MYEIVLNFVFQVLGILTTVFFTVFLLSSIKEKKTRPAVLSAIFIIIIMLIWGYVNFKVNEATVVKFIIAKLIIIFSVLFFIPTKIKLAAKDYKPDEKVDERDTLFAREEYTKGTDQYDSYYLKRPGYKSIDDKIRSLPRLLAPEGKYYDERISNYISETFDKIKKMTTSVDGVVSENKIEKSSSEFTSLVRNYLLERGAKEVGITKLNQMYVYSHVGRGPEEWGREIHNNHANAIVFTMEMDYFQVEKAPRIEITQETAEKYYRGAELSVGLANEIRSWGYPARAHISDSNYQIMLVPAAVDAGLGELGRAGYLISSKYGARVRLGGVTTDLPLDYDKPVAFGVGQFCMTCFKCAENCPPKAIPFEEETNVRGVRKWLMDSEKCIHYWRTIGTDCGLCMKVCPFSHPPTFVHNIVRCGIKKSSIARQMSIWGDDLFYGRKVKFE